MAPAPILMAAAVAFPAPTAQPATTIRPEIPHDPAQACGTIGRHRGPRFGPGLILRDPRRRWNLADGRSARHLPSMAFDLARAFARKQEVESARLDEYAFRHRARKIRLLAAGLAGRLEGEVDPVSLARRVAVETDEAILEALRARLLDPLPDAEWNSLVLAADVEARRQIVAEHGNPDPHRLA